MKKQKRPVSRKFWSLLKYLPGFVRAPIIRSKFDVELDLPKEITLKQAETEDEIKQALKLVYDSYVELDYIDRNAAEMRFSKYHALPSTVILVAKWQDEVIGTLSILPDSPFGLPAETTWSLEKYRSQGQIIAEISSLSIKKHFRMRRGKLLLPLCKIMYLYCTKALKLDGIVIATTLEVEPFYTDILLFEKVVKKTGQAHQLVKGNPSSCCFLKFGDDLEERYKEIYNTKPIRKNLYHFFTQAMTPNIQLPEPKNCIQSYTTQKNLSQAQILEEHSELIQEFSDFEKLILKNSDLTDALPESLSPKNENTIRSKRPEDRKSVV